MLMRTSIAAICLAGLAAGCFDIGADGLKGDRPRDRQVLPDEPVDKDQLLYETVGNTTAFRYGPYQVAPPSMLPPGTRLQLLDEPREPGYLAVRTAGGFEAFVPAVKVRTITDGVIVKNSKKLLEIGDDSGFFGKDGWF